jgi:hypothetical protein
VALEFLNMIFFFAGYFYPFLAMINALDLLLLPLTSALLIAI